MENGFILLHRKLRSNWIYKRPIYFHWFIDFIFRANFKDNNKYLFDGKFITVKRGEFITSYRQLAKELPMCSEQKIKTFIKILEKDKIISKKNIQKATHITICNYDSYQGEQHNSNTTATQQQHNSNTTATTIERKKKKENKEKDKYIAPDLFYQSELKNANGHHKEYNDFINILFGENHIETELKGVLSIKNQVTAKQFDKIWSLKVQHKKSIAEILLKIENDPKYWKGKTNLYMTLLNWIKKDF